MLTDEREATPHVEEFCYAGGIIDFVKFLNEGKDVPEAFKAVSYTHLDVYKRQSVRCNRSGEGVWKLGPHLVTHAQ